MDQIVVTWPEVVVVGILWLVAMSMVIGFQMWRFEVHGRVMQEVRDFISQNQPSHEQQTEHGAMLPPAVVDAMSTPPPVTLVRARPAPKHARTDVEEAIKQVRESAGKHTLVSSNWHEPQAGETDEPTISVEMVDDLDDDLDDDTIVGMVALVNAAEMAVWRGDEDEDPDSNRKTVEMWPGSRVQTLDVLRHVNEAS